MHGVLQGLGQDSLLNFEETSYARQAGTYVQRTFHFNAVSRLKKNVAFSSFLLYFIALWWCNCSWWDIFLTSVPSNQIILPLPPFHYYQQEKKPYIRQSRSHFLATLLRFLYHTTADKNNNRIVAIYTRITPSNLVLLTSNCCEI